MDKNKRIVNFLYEVGTMRKLPRMHRQNLLTEDSSDTIAAHSHRVAIIAWFLAKIEGVDLYKTMAMGLFHDIAEARTGDHNWIHKKYVKIYETEILEDQLGDLPFPDLKELLEEYEKRESKEAVIAKQADVLDQLLLLREYEWQGNKEAVLWLHGDPGKSEGSINVQLTKLSLPSALALGKKIYEVSPSEWWADIWTSKNR